MQGKSQGIISVDFDARSQKARVDKHLSDTPLVKNGFIKGSALLPLLCNFALEYGTKRVQVHQDGLKSSSTHQLLVYVDDVNILG
jgi:hypothetical protein